ncbi:MAG: 2-oxoglutarate and iron-dependent oxygenase domain-containing protein [Chitinophagales bacterium]
MENAKMNIPSVDLSKFVNGSSAEKNECVAELGKAFNEVGFVTVKNHGISEELVQRFYDQVNAFFDMDQELKDQYEKKELNGQRGYTSFGKEHAKHSNVGDLKEFWQFGEELTPEERPDEAYRENLDVAELPDFKKTGLELFSAFENSGRNLLKAIALYLKLDENYFEAHVIKGNSILRAIHYPPITSDPKTAIRAEQHEDINLITLLVGASAEGLQLLTKKGEWLPIMAPQGSIVVNVGDMLQRLTNNVLKSTTHRVVNPPREKWHLPRLSIPFFLHPKSDMPLNCLEDCVTEENPKQYENITAGEYLDQRLIEIGLKKA